MFLQASVILSTGGGRVSSSVHAGIPLREQTPPPGADSPLQGTRHPPEQTPPRADTPRTRLPLGADTTILGADTPLLGADTRLGPDPPGADSPWEQTPPLGADTPWEADASIRSMSGQYTSYWNAFLFVTGKPPFFAWYLLPAATKLWPR